MPPDGLHAYWLAVQDDRNALAPVPVALLLFMKEIEKIADFNNLYKAHRRARLGKRGNREVIRFEMRLSENLAALSERLATGRYRIGGYYSFSVHDPKKRLINALHYEDRVVQHCICDEVLMPALEKRLIYDSAACRTGKGTDFARERLTGFLREFYRKNGNNGYFLKCDIRKFFDNIDHDVLKERLGRVFSEPEVLSLLFCIIDSYEKTPGKGLPLGNQTSQWFATFYLDSLDRLVKEHLHIRYYSRYMDDLILIHPSKEYLKVCQKEMESTVKETLLLSFNEKTQIVPMKNGAEYLGFRFFLKETGRVVRLLSNTEKQRCKKRLKKLGRDNEMGIVSGEKVKQSLNSYAAHLSKGDTYRFRLKWLYGRGYLREEPS